jgi:hypothetical protein
MTSCLSGTSSETLAGRRPSSSSTRPIRRSSGLHPSTWRTRSRIADRQRPVRRRSRRTRPTSRQGPRSWHGQRGDLVGAAYETLRGLGRDVFVEGLENPDHALTMLATQVEIEAQTRRNTAQAKLMDEFNRPTPANGIYSGLTVMGQRLHDPVRDLFAEGFEFKHDIEGAHAKAERFVENFRSGKTQRGQSADDIRQGILEADPSHSPVSEGFAEMFKQAKPLFDKRREAERALNRR